MSALEGRRLRIAVVGSGVAGLSAAWLLSKKHDVTLFEKNTLRDLQRGDKLADVFARYGILRR